MRKFKSAISILVIMAVSINLSIFKIEAKINTDDDNCKLIIKYKDNTDKDIVYKNINKKHDNIKIDTLEKYKDNMDLIKVSGSDLESVISDLESDENIEFVQQDYVLNCENVYNTITPTDSYFSYQWGLKNNGQLIGNYGVKDVDINVIPAWTYTQGSDEVIIGVLDSGVYINHEDLHNNIYINKSEIPNNNIDDDNNGYIDDVNGWDFINNDNSVYDSFSEDLHGTFVAGIIAASSNNIGICGVAPNVKIMPLKFISDTQGHTSDAIRAIEYAESMGIDIINCSWGGLNYNKALKSAMNDIQKRCYSVGNQVLDIILNYYLTSIKKDVKINVTGKCMWGIKVDNVNLCTIFSNLIQNAVEELSIESTEDKYLNITVREGNDYVRIEIINSISNIHANKKEDFFKTQKHDRRNHGIGLQNVKKVIQCNGGIFNIKIENNNFRAIVILQKESLMMASPSYERPGVYSR
ncbi:S8 family serine peptidase [Clostridium sp. BNL1100]|uniref:S8 family serine peptidase n=1 Tax=Clostridium sp. BNL1100 TaxID=755731 RepID=UPI00024A7857|nr:S8 family serine peptidase [Clostridium sp. BNL1100]AEY67386.1 subtilisin-like serine protease [Clostridium sp. BNL1100]